MMASSSSGTPVNQHISQLTATHGASLNAGIITHVYGPVNLLHRDIETKQSPSYYEIPSRKVRYFVGREDILQKIDEALSDGPGPHCAVLHGIGGQGKSQVALEYCDRKKDCPYSVVFWVDASTQDRIEESFRSISERIKRPEDNLPDNNEKVAFVLRMFNSWTVQWLMVFDNFDNPKTFPNIQDFMPQSKLGAILVTSRHPDLHNLVINPSKHLIELPGLEEDAAVALLNQQSRTNEGISEDAKTIVKRLGCHPLAITQAGAHRRKRKLPFPELMNELKRQKKTILDYTPELSQYRKRLGNANDETSLNVFATWELSFQQLQSEALENDVDAKLLTLLAFFDEKDISEQLFKVFSTNQGQTSESSKLLTWLNAFRSTSGQWDSNLFRDQLIRFSDSSLLQTYTREVDGTYHASLHPLIKDWIRLRTDISTRQKYTCMAATLVKEVLVNSWQKGHFDLSLLAKQDISLHIIAVEENYQEFFNSQPALNQKIFGEYTISRFWFAGFLLSTGSYRLAAMINERLVAWNTKILGIEHEETLDSMVRLATAFLRQGQYEEAEKLEKKVMKIRERVLGPEHPSTLTIMANLASTYQNQGRWKEAEELGKQVMSKRSSVLGLEHLETLTSTADLASTFCLQGRWKEAEKLYVQLEDTSLTVLGLEHPLRLTWTADLASTYQNQGRWKDAEQLEVQVRETKSKVLGPEHPETLTSTANLASTYSNQGRWKEAEELYVQVKEISLRVLGPEHPSTLTNISNLASTFWDQGRWKEAEELYVQVKEIFLRVLGPEHPSTLTNMSNLASTYRNQARWKEAEELEMQVKDTTERKLGPEHPDTLTSMANLAVTYQNQGRLKEAEELYVQVKEISLRVLGPEHPSTLTNISNLASTLWNQGRLEEAKNLELEILETRKMVLGPKNPSTLASMSNLGSIYWDQGKRQEAKEKFEEVVDANTGVLGREHPDTMTSINNLAIASWCLDLKKEAIQLIAEVIQYREKMLGSDHPHTIQSMEVLRKWQDENQKMVKTCN